MGDEQQMEQEFQQEDGGQQTEEPMETGERTENFDKYLGMGFTEKVAAELDKFLVKKILAEDELDKRALDALKELDESSSIGVLKQFSDSDISDVNNKSAFLCGVIKLYKQKNKIKQGTAEVETKGPDEAKTKSNITIETEMAEGYTCTVRERRSLECSICLERFRNPKTLPCLHSYCEECLVTYALEGPTTIKCPQCKEEVEVPDGDARNFKSNFHLKELTEEAAFREELGQPSTKLICNCCAGGDTEAVSRCLDCNQYLCSSGMAAHQRFSVLRDHVVASLDDIRSGKVTPKSSSKQKMMCQKHPDNKAEIFCTTCEVPICHVCATLKHKSTDHECIEVSDATEERRQLAVKGLTQLEAVKSKFQEAADKVEGNRQILTTHAADLKEIIGKRCDAVLQQVDGEKKKLQEVVDDALAADISKLDKYQVDTKECISKMSSIQEQAKMMVEDASSGDFLSMYDILKTKIDQLCTEKPQAPSSSVTILSVMVSDTPRSLVGSISASVKKTLKLVGEYPKQLSQQAAFLLKRKRDFYGITSFGDNMLAVIDRVTSEVIILDSDMNYIKCFKRTDGSHGYSRSSLPVLKSPCGVAFAGNSKLVVVDGSGVGKWYTDGSSQGEFKVDNFIPHCIASDSDEGLIIGGVTTKGDRKLVNFGWDSKASNYKEEGLVSNSIVQFPSFIATNGRHIVAADEFARQVSCLVSQTSWQGFTTSKTPAFVIECTGKPKGVCRDGDGDLFVAVEEFFINHSIHQYTSAGQHVACLGKLKHPINGMAYRKDGKLVVACGESVKLFTLF